MPKKKSYTSILKKAVASNIIPGKVLKERSDICSLVLHQKWLHKRVQYLIRSFFSTSKIEKNPLITKVLQGVVIDLSKVSDTLDH